MNGNDVKPPAFCPACGAKVRRSMAERLGISSTDLGNIIIAAVVFLGFAIIATIVACGIVVGHKNKNEHDAEMMRGGYVQRTRVVEPSTAFRAGTQVTEWVREEATKKEEK